MEAGGFTRPFPRPTGLSEAQVVKACQQVPCSKADAFLEVCRCPALLCTEICMLTISNESAVVLMQAGKRQLRERGSTILFRPRPDPSATTDCYRVADG